MGRGSGKGKHLKGWWFKGKAKAPPELGEFIRRPAEPGQASEIRDRLRSTLTLHWGAEICHHSKPHLAILAKNRSARSRISWSRMLSIMHRLRLERFWAGQGTVAGFLQLRSWTSLRKWLLLGMVQTGWKGLHKRPETAMGPYDTCGIWAHAVRSSGTWVHPLRPLGQSVNCCNGQICGPRIQDWFFFQKPHKTGQVCSDQPAVLHKAKDAQTAWGKIGKEEKAREATKKDGWGNSSTRRIAFPRSRLPTSRSNYLMLFLGLGLLGAHW